MLPELEKRRVATEKTLKRFRGKDFDWKGNRHCIALSMYQAKNMGHKIPPLPRIRSALAAKKELKARGFDTVTELLDSMFERIPPAMMRLGDICALPGEAGLDGVIVSDGRLKGFGWHETQSGLVVLDFQLSNVTAAWRL